MSSSVRTSFREERENQRHMTAVVTSLCAPPIDVCNPQQLQLGNIKCLNRTAWSFSPGSTALNLGCHSSVQAHLSSLCFLQSGEEVAGQILGSCGCVRMTTSLVNNSRLLPDISTEPCELTQVREALPQADPLLFSHPCGTHLPKPASPKAQPRLCV